jgi:Tfp pilus assembly protein PilF
LAGQHYRKALELNRNRPQLLAALGYFHACLGEPDVALAYFREAKLLDPIFDPAWTWAFLAVAHFVARQYDDAIVALGRSTTTFRSLGYLAACQALANRMDSARASAAETVRLAPAFSAVQFVAKESFKRLEDRQLLLDGLGKAGLPE